MRLSKEKKQELYDEVMSKTDKPAEIAELKRLLAEEGEVLAGAYCLNEWPEFTAAIDATPLVIRQQLDGCNQVSFSCSNDEPLRIAYNFLFGDSVHFCFYVNINRVRTPLHKSIPTMILSGKLREKMLKCYQKYWKIESALWDVLYACSTKKQLETLLPDVAALLPREIKQLPMTVPTQTIEALSSVGFPKGVVA